jgi:3-hydroxy-9,10-secoandrosta-1,3,5(10)-triene-9,17-dione monooxygenase
MKMPLTHSAAGIRAEALGRAAALVPVLKERASRTEQLRQIPAETVRDLAVSGLVRGRLVRGLRRRAGRELAVAQ